jgi:Putative prokaryotic signal transducing protein
MEEVFRTNDLIKLSYVQHLLQEAGIEYFVADQHIAAVEGSIGAFPRRVLVPDELKAQAVAALAGVEWG